MFPGPHHLIQTCFDEGKGFRMRGHRIALEKSIWKCDLVWLRHEEERIIVSDQLPLDLFDDCRMQWPAR